MASGKAQAERLAAKGLKGIFGKVAGDFFRLSKKGAKKEVHLLHPTKEAKERAAKFGTNRAVPNVPGPRVRSKKLGADERTDLLKATEDARRAKHDASGKNYAAYRYIDKDGQERILVSHSDGSHSERVGGALLLDEMRKGNVLKVTEVYTERSPCAPGTGYCGEWLHQHFAQHNPGFEVTHSHDYGINGTSKSQANAAVKAHARSLLGS